MNGDQCRSARALLGLSKTELASLAGTASRTITRIEAGDDGALASTGGRIRAVLVVEGADFLDDADRCGVRIRPERLGPNFPKPSPSAPGPASSPIEIDAADEEKVDPVQCRAARGFLGWTRKQAAQALGIGVSSIQIFENGLPGPQARIIEKIVAGFKEHGITFSRSTRHLSVHFNDETT